MRVRADTRRAARRALHRGLLGALTATLVQLPCAAADGQSGHDVDAAAEAVLERMADAMRRVEYEGTLVYLHGHHLTTLRIAHRIDGGESRESLLALNGPIRAVARNQRGLTCVLPDASPISVKPAPGDGGVLRRAPPNPTRLAPYYLIHPLGQSRVAGRDTDVIGIIPRDNLRYGYRFYVDQATGLPLKTDLMDQAATPIEQVMFTELTVVDPALSPVPDAAAEGRTEAPAAPAAASERGLPDAERESRWAFSQLPPGFRVVAHENSDAATEHLMVSDGLASVSVYVEADTGPGLRGATRMGAVHAAGRLVDGHQVTAVGEVPAATLDAILSAVEPAP
jgi:sigma-E factor negative regulatory protein RseB